jgi:hypothetical protein
MANLFIVPPHIPALWDNVFSACSSSGSILTFAAKVAKEFDSQVVGGLSDGIISSQMFEQLQNRIGSDRFDLMPLTCGNIYCDELESKVPSRDKPCIIAGLVIRDLERANIALLPLDDATFDHGLKAVLSQWNESLSPWSERKSVLFWRGCNSGAERPLNIRMQTVAKLRDVPGTNVKLTHNRNVLDRRPMLDSDYAPEWCGLSTHFQFKYLAIIDGSGIASNHQWIFGSGSVPIMITHPSNQYWFSKWLVPMKNYVPVKYDLSDLLPKLQWLQDNDGQAEEIAKSAKEFADSCFTSEFQHRYVEEEVKRAILSWQFSKLKSVYLTNLTTENSYLCEVARECQNAIWFGRTGDNSKFALAHGLCGKSHNVCFVQSIPFPENDLQILLDSDIHFEIKVEDALTHEPTLTDLIYLNTFGVYSYVKRLLKYWAPMTQRYIVIAATTIDAFHGEYKRLRARPHEISSEHEIMLGVWPAIVLFLRKNDNWRIRKQIIGQDGLTILERVR